MAIDQRPIFIAGPPRCGTTMLAGLLNIHGVWVGQARTTWYPGTNPEFGSENQDIKAIMKREAAKIGYRNWTVPIPEDMSMDEDYYEMIKNELKRDILPNDERWLVKTSWTLMFYKFWMWAWPDALWVLTQRDVKYVLNSMNRHPRMARRPENMKRNFIEALQERQRQVLGRANSTLSVDVFKVSQGSTEEIQQLFDFVKIKVDLRKVRQWIQPGRMKQ